MRSLSLTVVSIMLLGLCVGCTSQSYKIGVRGAYPKVADRLDQLADQQTPAGDSLRAAAVDPITFTKASKAWADAAPAYRNLISANPTLSIHRRADWLKTADLLDKLNADEAKHESFLFIKPPTSQPAAPSP